ncbi:MAG: type II toxin-antitoxin system RelE/ParE family toxin [Verrucomicrobiae bacterium]|nr:type II toxin-antitoxin system RelE/ParE family toxin [Verrucomicrobiae bacterium]
MNEYSVELRPASARFLKKCKDQDLVQKLAESIDSLIPNPRPTGVEKLSGMGNRYRIRCGDYRIIYEIYDARQTIIIMDIGHRRDIYR